MTNHYLRDKNKLFQYLFMFLSLSIYCGFLVTYLNASNPIVGHDYSFFFPHLLDEYTHLKINGLSIQWFTPSFGGGLPAFANPQNLQFSLPQILMVFFNPWNAILIASVFYSSLGYWAFYRFSREVLKTNWIVSQLGALLFIVNGFYIEHLAAGHLAFQTFPLVAVFLYLLFTTRLRPLIASILIGLTGAALIFSGSFYTVIIIFLSLIISIPLIFFFKPELLKIKSLGKKIFLGSLLSGLLSFGKIYAVLSFMEQFPRIVPRNNYFIYYEYFIEAVLGVAWQMLGVMSLAPYYYLRGDDPRTVVDTLESMARFTGIWETDISLSPVLLILVGLGILWLLFQRKRFIVQEKKYVQLISAVFLLLAIWLVFDFSTARGPFFELLSPLPILRSMHVNQRNVAAFILPAAVFATIVSSSMLSSLKPKAQKIWGFSFSLVALSFLGTYFMLQIDLQGRVFNISDSLSAYENIKNGEILPVTQIQEGDDAVLSLIGSSSLIPNETIFGYARETFKSQLIVGSPLLTTDGYLNFTNPIGLMYPEETGVLPFERFKLEDQEVLESFLNRKQPSWDLPFIQLFSIGLSVVTFFVCIAYLLFLAFRTIIKKGPPFIQSLWFFS